MGKNRRMQHERRERGQLELLLLRCLVHQSIRWRMEDQLVWHPRCRSRQIGGGIEGQQQQQPRGQGQSKEINKTKIIIFVQTDGFPTMYCTYHELEHGEDLGWWR